MVLVLYRREVPGQDEEANAFYEGRIARRSTILHERPGCYSPQTPLGFLRSLQNKRRELVFHQNALFMGWGSQGPTFSLRPHGSHFGSHRSDSHCEDIRIGSPISFCLLPPRRRNAPRRQLHMSATAVDPASTTTEKIVDLHCWNAFTKFGSSDQERLGGEVGNRTRDVSGRRSERQSTRAAQWRGKSRCNWKLLMDADDQDDPMKLDCYHQSPLSSRHATFSMRKTASGSLSLPKNLYVRIHCGFRGRRVASFDR